MDNIKSTGTRLRRTFRYPAEDDDTTDSQPEVMDEEEQEDLIRSLAAQNALRNTQFRRLLLALPIAASIPYLAALGSRSTFLLAVLGLSSLASTAYLVHSHPPETTGIDILDSWAQPAPGRPAARPAFGDSSSSSGSSSPYSAIQPPPTSSSLRRRTSSLPISSSAPLAFGAHRSPLEQHLPYLNLGLCVVLIMTGLLTRPAGFDAHPVARIGLGNLPAIIYAVVLAAKMVMASVDPEMELGGLKYEYKGA